MRRKSRFTNSLSFSPRPKRFIGDGVNRRGYTVFGSWFVSRKKAFKAWKAQKRIGRF